MNQFTRWLVRFFVISVLFLLVAVAALPSLISIKGVHQFLLSSINKSIPVQISAEDIRVGWLAGVKIDGLQVIDPRSQSMASCQNILYDHSLISLLYAPRHLGKVQIKKPIVQLTNDSQKQEHSSTSASKSPKPSKSEGKSSLPATSLSVKVDDGSVIIATANEPTIRMTELSFELDIEEGKTAQMAFFGHIENGKQPGSIEITTSVSDIAGLSDAYNTVLENLLSGKQIEAIGPEVSFNCKIDNFPLKIVDTFLGMVDPKYADLATKAIGPTLQASLSHTFKDKALAFSADVQASHLKMFMKENTAHFVWDMEPEFFTEIRPLLPKNLPQDITLDKPFYLQMELDPQTPSSLTIDSKAPLLLRSSQWSNPLSINGKLQVSSASLKKSIQANGLVDVRLGDQKANAQFNSTIFTNEKELLKIGPSTFTASVNGGAMHQLSGLQTSDAAVAVNIRSVEMPFDPSLFNKRMTADLSIVLQPLSLSKIESIDSIDVKETEIMVTKEQNSPLEIACDTKLGLEKVPAAWQQFIDKTVSLTVKTPVVIDQNIAYLNKVHAQLIAKETLNIEMPLKFDLIKKKVNGDLLVHSPTSKTQVQSTFSADTSLIHSNGSIKHLSTELLAVAAKKPELSTLLGQELSGSWNVSFDPTLQQMQPCLVDLEGEGLSFQLALSLGKNIEALPKKNPFTMQWQLTPKRLDALKQPNAQQTKKFLLQKPATIDIVCKKIDFPLEAFLQGKREFTPPAILDTLNLDLGVEVGKLEFISQKTNKEKSPQEELSIDPLKGTASLQGTKRTLFFDLHSEKTAANKSSAQLNVSGEVKNLWTDVALQPEKASIKFRAVVKDFPLEVLQTEEIVAVLGSKMNADINADVEQLRNGTFQGDINTPRIHSSVAFDLQDGKLRLQKPLTAQYELTQEAGEVLLKGINPLLASAARSENPIKLLIDNKDFNISLNPFSLEDMVIKSVKIEPGILTVKNKGFITLLVSLLKIPVTNGELPLWFTPIYISVKNGVVTCERSDTLVANAFPIATWGKIDLVNDKMDMVLGLSGTAVSRAFGVTSLDPEYLVQIPMKGTVQSPKFDTTRATAKITALKLMKNKSNTTALLGGLLEVATDVGSKESKPPAPTTYPFPWQKQR